MFSCFLAVVGELPFGDEVAWDCYLVFCVRHGGGVDQKKNKRTNQLSKGKDKSVAVNIKGWTSFINLVAPAKAVIRCVEQVLELR